MSHRQKILIGCLLALAWPMALAFPHIDLVTSKSIDHRLFWITDARPQRLDYALLTLSHPLAGPQPVRLTKQLRCWSGDTLTVKSRDYYCNGDFLGHAKETGNQGQSLPQFVYNGVIPDGKAFAYGTHLDSFDSRYWGFVDIAQTRKALVLF